MYYIHYIYTIYILSYILYILVFIFICIYIYMCMGRQYQVHPKVLARPFRRCRENPWGSQFSAHSVCFPHVVTSFDWNNNSN